MTKAAARVEYEPLVEATVTDQGDALSVEALAVQLGVSERTIYRWRKMGVLTVYQADRAAIALGSHPALIWGDDFYDEVDE